MSVAQPILFFQFEPAPPDSQDGIAVDVRCRRHLPKNAIVVGSEDARQRRVGSWLEANTYHNDARCDVCSLPKLTKRQYQELEALAKAPRTTANRRFDNFNEAEPWRGKKVTGCARVQNSLSKLGLAYFCDEDGVQRPVSVYIVVSSYGNPRPQCRITDRGRKILARLKEAKP